MNKFGKINRAVFPVAGMGTRFLPATKASPKEMMPIVDKPLIQYAVEEAISSGIEQLVFITNSNKRAVEDHFDYDFELEEKMKKKGNEELLNTIRNILPKKISCVYIHQSEAIGLGNAILCARHVLDNEPFAVLLADDLIEPLNNTPCLQQMINFYSHERTNIIAAEEIDIKNSTNYGMIEIDKTSNIQGNLLKIKHIIEKPLPKESPSNLAAVGRYIFTPTIFTKLETINSGKNDEIQLTDAISSLLNEETIFAYKLQSKRHDCGNKLGYMQAVVEHGLRHKEISEEFREYIKVIQVK